MTENKLLPCPFCGGEAKHGYDGDPIFGRIVHWVYCDNCHAQTREITDKEYVFRLWNKRSTYSKIPNNWHTGVPTEEGLYVIAYRFGNKIEHEIRELFYSPDYGMTFGIKKDIVAWQKIEPYKGEEANG